MAKKDIDTSNSVFLTKQGLKELKKELNEFSCGIADTGVPYARSETVECPGGCDAAIGACVCEDTDGGFVPEVYGRVGLNEDQCTGLQTLTEVDAAFLGGKCVVLCGRC